MGRGSRRNEQAKERKAWFGTGNRCGKSLEEAWWKVFIYRGQHGCLSEEFLALIRMLIAYFFIAWKEG